jgi:tetratricopeptide (TPR) repeat protein
MPETTPDVVENYRATVTASPNSAEAHCNLGWGYYGRKLYQEAIQEFEAAIKLDTNWLDAYYGLGLARKGAGSKTDAVAAFEKAAALSSQSSDVVRGQMLLHLIHAHINALKTGDWGLDKELRLRAS